MEKSIFSQVSPGFTLGPKTNLKRWKVNNEVLEKFASFCFIPIDVRPCPCRAVCF